MRMEEPRQRFEALVVEALDGLPIWIRERLENVEVLIEEDGPHGQPALLGLYEGVPLTSRGISYAGVLPDRITLYRTSIERLAADEDALRRLIAHTVAHEVGHHFGISDDRLREIDAY